MAWTGLRGGGDSVACLPTVALLPSDLERTGGTMRNLLALAVVGSLSLSLIGCSTPCRLTPDPDCDRTKADHVCAEICAPENVQEDDFSEVEDQQASHSSERVDS